MPLLLIGISHVDIPTSHEDLPTPANYLTSLWTQCGLSRGGHNGFTGVFLSTVHIELVIEAMGRELTDESGFAWVISETEIRMSG